MAIMDTLVECRKFNTLGELYHELNDLLSDPEYGDSSKGLLDSPVNITGPDDRSTPPFETELQLYDKVLSDGSHTYNVSLVMGEA